MKKNSGNRSTDFILKYRELERIASPAAARQEHTGRWNSNLNSEFSAANAAGKRGMAIAEGLLTIINGVVSIQNIGKTVKKQVLLTFKSTCMQHIWKLRSEKEEWIINILEKPRDYSKQWIHKDADTIKI